MQWTSKPHSQAPWDSQVVLHTGFPFRGQPYPPAQSLDWESKSLLFILEIFKLAFLAFIVLPDLLPHKVESNKISKGLLGAPVSIAELQLGIILSLFLQAFVGWHDTPPAWELRQGILFSQLKRRWSICSKNNTHSPCEAFSKGKVLGYFPSAVTLLSPWSPSETCPAPQSDKLNSEEPRLGPGGYSWLNRDNFVPILFEQERRRQRCCFVLLPIQCSIVYGLQHMFISADILRDCSSTEQAVCLLGWGWGWE